jgi:hypothetical protein
MNRKGFAPILIAIIVAGLLVVGGIWYYETHKSETSPAATSSMTTSTSQVASSGTANVQLQNSSTAQLQNQTNSTSGWQTYTNQQYGFAFQYPSGTQVVENGSGTFESTVLPGKPVIDEPTLAEIDLREGSVPVIQIVIPANKEFPVVQNNIWQMSFCGGGDDAIQSTTALIFVGYPTLKVVGSNGTIISYCVNNPVNPLMIFYYPLGYSMTESERVLSTFRFTH